MKKSITWWEGFGFIVTSLLGTLLHFLYGWTQSFVAALFSSVNESTWEHMKLLFFPMAGFALVQRFFFSDIKAYWCIKAKGITLGVCMIPVLFYLYNGVIGPSGAILNIVIFFLADGIGYAYECRHFKKEIPCRHPRMAIALLVLWAVLFAVFTFFAPELALFSDPLSGTYGI